MNNKVKICLDRQIFFTKPTEEHARQLSTRIGKFTKQLTASDIRAFALDVSLDGRTFCPATFNDGKRSKDNWEQQQLFPLDFDNKDPSNRITPEEALERAEQYGLKPLFGYRTLSSSTEDDKFRFVFMNDVPITDRIVAEAMSRSLGIIYPEADQSCCKDVSKMYYGGKELLFYNEKEEPIDIEKLFRGMTYYWKKNNPNHYREKNAKFSRETGIGLNRNGLLDVTVEYPTEQSGAISSFQNGESSPSSIIYSLYNRIVNGEISPIKQYRINLTEEGSTSKSSVGRKKPGNHAGYRSSDIDNVRSGCRLCREFESGQVKLSHDEQFGVATNMIQMESGASWVMNVLSAQPQFYGSKLDKWQHDLAYMRQLDYRPQGCDSFCRYCKTCTHGTNILSTAAPKRGTMERIAGYVESYDPLEDLQENVYRAVSKALRSLGKMIQVVKAMTGSGKTYTYQRLMSENPTTRFLIANPTNILKDESFGKADKLGLDVFKTPSLEQIKTKIPRNIWNDIQLMYKTGRHSSVHSYIIEKLKEKYIPPLGEYLKAREALKSFGGSVFTTHRYLLNMDEKRLREYDAVIIDEDILLKSVFSNQGEITLEDLDKLMMETGNVRLIKKIAKILKLAEKQDCVEVDAFEWADDTDESDGISTPFDIPSFCLTKKFYIRRSAKEKNLKQDTVTFIKPVTFYKNVKYIIISATADKDMYCNYFGEDNVNFHECKQAQYEGDLLQYPGKSMSRTCIDNNHGIVQRISTRLGIDKILTHKKYKLGPLWYGNNEGSNLYEGQDMIVAGTPYHAEFLYKLIAFEMGLDFDENEEMKRYLVTHNGYRFWFTTYNNENLRAIHFWMVESEIEQAVGRARLLRHKCTVHLFSNFPVRQAKMVTDFDYDNHVNANGTVEGER